MTDRLQLIVCTAIFVGTVSWIAMHTEPGKGIIKLMERIMAGAVVCWLLGVLLAPLGIEVAQSPLAAVSAGFWGIPGAALASLLACWP